MRNDLKQAAFPSRRNSYNNNGCSYKCYKKMYETCWSPDKNGGDAKNNSSYEETTWQRQHFLASFWCYYNNIRYTQVSWVTANIPTTSTTTELTVFSYFLFYSGGTLRTTGFDLLVDLSLSQMGIVIVTRLRFSLLLLYLFSFHNSFFLFSTTTTGKSNPYYKTTAHTIIRGWSSSPLVASLDSA